MEIKAQHLAVNVGKEAEHGDGVTESDATICFRLNP